MELGVLPLRHCISLDYGLPQLLPSHKYPRLQPLYFIKVLFSSPGFFLSYQQNYYSLNGLSVAMETRLTREQDLGNLFISTLRSSITLLCVELFALILSFMQTAAEFISDFIRAPLKNLNGEEELRSALTGVIGLDKVNLHEAVVRKLIAALRKKKCKVDTPRNKDPFEVLVKWIAAAPVTGDLSSGAVNNSLQEPGQNLSAPKRAKRKSSRKRTSRSSDSEDEPAPVNNGDGSSNNNDAANNPANADNSANATNPANNNNEESSTNCNANTGGTTPPLILVPEGGSGANAGIGIPAPTPSPTATRGSNKNSEGLTPDAQNTAKGVVFDQQSYVTFLGLIDRVNSQLDDLKAEQKRTREVLSKQKSAESPRSPPTPKRSRKASSPKVDPKTDSPKSPESQFSPGTRADISELDRFISDPFDEGGMDEESRDLQNALSDFSKHVARDDDDVLIVSEHGDSNDESDDYHTNRATRDHHKSQAPHLKYTGLRPTSERTRAITHQNGFPEAIKWLRSKGISLARFVAGHETQTLWHKS